MAFSLKKTIISNVLILIFHKITEKYILHLTFTIKKILI